MKASAAAGVQMVVPGPSPLPPTPPSLLSVCGVQEPTPRPAAPAVMRQANGALLGVVASQHLHSLESSERFLQPRDFARTSIVGLAPL